MARTRYIKPDFFTDEDIADLPLEARLVFIGLWCHADRKGRLEDRPKFFKVALAPYDNFDIEAIIGVLALAEKPFIKHYEVDGKRYIQIINFEKHQRPHHTERDSIIPDPKKGLTVKERLDNGYLTVRQRSAPLYSSNGDGDGNENGEGEVREDKREHEDKAAAQPSLLNPGEPEPTAALPALDSLGQTETDKSDAKPQSDKTDTIKKGTLPVGQYPETDIIAVGAHYCDLQGMHFVSEESKRVYLRGKGMFYPAKDLLALNQGDVELAKLCLTHLSDHYENRESPLTDWNWNHVLTDWQKWNDGIQDQLREKEQEVE